MPVTVPIDPALTAHPAKPARPADNCKDANGTRTLCNSDLAGWLLAYDALVDRLLARLDAIRGLQPK